MFKGSVKLRFFKKINCLSFNAIYCSVTYLHTSKRKRLYFRFLNSFFKEKQQLFFKKSVTMGPLRKTLSIIWCTNDEIPRYFRREIFLWKFVRKMLKRCASKGKKTIPLKIYIKTALRKLSKIQRDYFPNYVILKYDNRKDFLGSKKKKKMLKKNKHKIWI